jgi:hypothetical protein
MARQDFFLSPDDAQTLGNILYMKKRVKIKRSFPKTQKNQSAFEVEKEIASLEDRFSSFNGNGNTASSNNFVSTSVSQTDYTPSTKGVTEEQKRKDVEERRKEDTSLDMFRTMARSIKKK